jgi:response regulator RpfG family c-di-GMP phosphodiesterase
MSASSEDRARILCVDDEPNILEGLKLHLRRRYDVVTASSGIEGLAEIERGGPPEVVLSDMRMPGMDGAAFLSRVRGVAPDTVRLLLTGQADLNSCIAAINEGQIFRFLSKPCQPDALLDTMKAAIEQYRLITSERVLLEQTLRGSIKTLTDVLALASPLAFGRASRIKDAVAQLSEEAGLGVSWQVEVAAMLSHIGSVTLPLSTAEKLYYGETLNAEERKMTERLPLVAEQLLANIPRLEEVRAILLNQDNRYDGSVRTPGGFIGESIPVGARVLKIVNDYDALEVRGVAAGPALDTMRSRSGWYDPILLEAFCRMRRNTVQSTEIREIPLKMVQIGMVFANDVRTPGGVLLIARGHEVTTSLVQRILNFPSDVSRQRVRVTASLAAEQGSRMNATILPS